MKSSDFGKDFVWGTATASYQTEGAWNEDGKTESIWDRFAHTKGKIYQNQNGDVACDHYHRYPEDIALMKQMNLNAYRFSLSWNRILPNGTGAVNPKGIDFYKRLMDKCLENGIQPWVTLYHWDLPQVLQDKGGWVNRDSVKWFEEYVDKATRPFADLVKHWMIFNEPTSFVMMGYFLGLHAPGIKGLRSVMPASHHVNLSQAAGGRVARANCPNAEIGTTYFTSDVQPLNPGNQRDVRAAARFDAAINRLFIEPILGMGYPFEAFPTLKRAEKYFQPGDDKAIQFDFDFHGLQFYSREIVKHSWFTPIVWGNIVEAKNRNVKELTDLYWEVYPEGIYNKLKYLGGLPGVKKIYVTENGAAFKDVLQNGQVHDKQRIDFLQRYMAQVLRAKNEGLNIQGYFVWSFMDNFEWSEGYRPRFGLVYVDYETQQRYLKDSGLWIKDFLSQ